MDLSFANNLFLGRQEYQFFKDSVKSEGYQKALQQFIRNYGVVRIDTTDPGFDYLRVVQGSTPAKLTIKAGKAIDSNINIIHVVNDLIDKIDVPGDSVTRYVVIKYKNETKEKGTIDVSANGTLTGNGTSFEEKLRGLPDFPSKVRFPNSAVNTGEYAIQSITDNLNAQLNIAGGLMTAETGLEWEVVGTFTPGIPVPNSNKFPFKNSGYDISLRTSPTIISGEEFILAEVLNNGSTTNIIDRRGDYLIEINIPPFDKPSQTNQVIGVESAQYNATHHPHHTNKVKVGWGFNSNSGDWSYNGAVDQITIATGLGGAWKSNADHINGALDGWRVYFHAHGEYVGVEGSSLSGGNVILDLKDTGNPVPTSGAISVVPLGTQIEVLLKNASYPAMDQSYLFDMSESEAYVQPAVNQDTTITYRHINFDRFSEEKEINDSTYFNETAFNAPGVRINNNTSNIVSAKYTPVPNTDNFFDKKAWINKSNTFEGGLQAFDQSSGTIDYFLADDKITLPDTGNAFLINNSKFEIYYIQDFPDGTFISLKMSNGGSLYNSGGPSSVPNGARVSAEPTLGTDRAQFEGGDVLLFYKISGVWNLIGSRSSASAGRRLFNLETTLDAPWGSIGLSTLESVVYQNDNSSGAGADILLDTGTGSQAPQSGSYLKYRVLGNMCTVQFRLNEIILTDHNEADAASVVIRNVVPPSQNDFYAAFHIHCHSHGGVVAGIQSVRMSPGGNDIVLTCKAIAQSTTAWNRRYKLTDPATGLDVTSATDVFNPRYSVSGTFTYEV